MIFVGIITVILSVVIVGVAGRAFVLGLSTKQSKAIATKVTREFDKFEQEKDDYAFYDNQLKRYYKLINEANINLLKAQKAVDLDMWMDEHDTPPAEKVIKKHITERDRLVKTVIRLENSIHASEKKLAKVKETLGK